MASALWAADTPLPHDVTTGPSGSAAPAATAAARRPSKRARSADGGRNRPPGSTRLLSVGALTDGRDVARVVVDRLGFAAITWRCPGVEQHDLASRSRRCVAIDRLRPVVGQPGQAVGLRPATARSRRWLAARRDPAPEPAIEHGDAAAVARGRRASTTAARRSSRRRRRSATTRSPSPMPYAASRAPERGGSGQGMAARRRRAASGRRGRVSRSRKIGSRRCGRRRTRRGPRRACRGTSGMSTTRSRGSPSGRRGRRRRSDRSRHGRRIRGEGQRAGPPASCYPSARRGPGARAAGATPRSLAPA